MTKKCNKCLEVKDTTEFHRNNKLKNGFVGACKKCRSRSKNSLEPEPLNLEGEIWKPIIGFETCYHISNFGRVKLLERKIPYKNSTDGYYLQLEKIKSCSVSSLYRRVGLTDGVKKLMIAVHRLVALHFISNPENKPHINHIDCNKLNNMAENLEWCTAHENVTHAAKNGLRNPVKGDKHWNSKYTDDQIRNVKSLINIGYNRDEIVKELGFDISYTQITNIKKGKNWTHITI